MDKTKSSQETNAKWHHFELNIKLTPAAKKVVLAVVKKKMKEAIKTLKLSEAGLEAVCSQNLSVDVYVKQEAYKSIIPANVVVDKVVSLSSEKEKTNQPTLIPAQANGTTDSEITSDSHETITYRGAVKEPPPTPDPLLP